MFGRKKKELKGKGLREFMGTLTVGGEVLLIESLSLKDGEIVVDASGIASSAFPRGLSGQIEVNGVDGRAVGVWENFASPDPVGVGDYLHMDYRISVDSTLGPVDQWVLGGRSVR